MWSEVKKQSNKEIYVFSIDQKRYKKFQYKGDSLKVLGSLNLDQFDVIDLDAYGIPFAHLEILFRKKYRGVVHVTCIQSGMGSLPTKLLNALGYSNDMIRKCRTVFNVNGADKLKGYLANNGVTSIQCLNMGRKNYFYFNA